MKRCLYCYQLLSGTEVDYHPSCSKKIFGSTTAPALDYTDDEMGKLAAEIIRTQHAVTGVQAKLSLEVINSDKHARFTISGLWGSYILKPQTEKYQCMPEVEDLTMHLATIAKIPTIPHALIPLKSGTLAYITKRLDRENGKKMAMEDMCQLAERLTEDKYKSSHEQVAKLIKKYSANPMLDVVNFYEQVAFSFLTGNADMHLKNFSLIKNTPQGYTLMPAYDMVATALVNKADTEELALTLDGRKRKLNRVNFVNAMHAGGLNSKQQQAIFDKFTKAIPVWKVLIAISFIPDEMKGEYIKLVDERAKQLQIS